MSACSLAAIGQGLDTTFQYSVDLGGAEAAIGIVASPSGYKVVGAGSVYDTTFYSGFWIGDLTTAGGLVNTQWHGQAGTTWTPNLNPDLIQAHDGLFVYAGGESNGIDRWYPLVLWFDSTGQLIRKEIYPDSRGSAVIHNGLQMPDSSFFFYGNIYSLDNPRDRDRYLLKLDKAGNKVWAKTYGGNWNDWGLGTTLVKRKVGLVLGGYAESYSQYGGRDGWLIYTNFAGQVMREKFFGTQGDDGSVQIALAPDSLSLYLAQHIDTLLQPGYAPWAYQIMKLDPLGNPEWRIILQDSLSRYAYGIYTLANGDVLVYGVLDIFHTPPNGFGWLARISAQGSLLWEKAYQYPDHGNAWNFQSNSLYDVVELPGSHILLVGTTMVRDNGGQNPWIVQVDSNGCFSTHCDSLPAPWREPPTALETAPVPGIKLYPNPAQDHLILQLAARHLPAQFELWDSQGRLVYQQPLTELQTRVDVSALAGGLYVAAVRARGGTIARQKVVLRR